VWVERPTRPVVLAGHPAFELWIRPERQDPAGGNERRVVEELVIGAVAAVQRHPGSRERIVRPDDREVVALVVEAGLLVCQERTEPVFDDVVLQVAGGGAIQDEAAGQRRRARPVLQRAFASVGS
jgi:hypothetical protein